MRILVFLCLLGTTTQLNATQRYFQNTPELKRQWSVLNSECRGGQHTPDDAVCQERDRIEDALERRGVCWACSDYRVYPFDYRWHPCSQKSPKGWKPS